MSESEEAGSKVLVGRDGFLFLTNDTNRVLDQVEGRYQLSERQIWATASAHAGRRAQCRALGARYDHVIVPDREILCRKQLPPSVASEKHGRRPVAQYRASEARKLHDFIYDTETLRQPAEPPSLFKRDTHWTSEGSVRYMKTVLPRLGCDLAAYDSYPRATHPYQNPGDLGSKIGAEPEDAVIIMPETPILKPVYDNGLPNLGHMRLFLNPTQDPAERWLVLHDSFGEWLTLMLPLLAHATCFLHMPDWDPMFVRDFRPSRIIFLQIERFFVRQPQNGLDLAEWIAAQARGKKTPLPPLPADLAESLFPRGRSAGESWAGLPA